MRLEANLSQVVIDKINPRTLGRLGSKDLAFQHQALGLLFDKKMSEIAKNPTGSLVSAIKQLSPCQGISLVHELWRDWEINARDHSKQKAWTLEVLREAFTTWVHLHNISSSSDEGPPPLVSSSSDDMGDLRQRATDNSPDDESSDPDSSFDWENSPFEISRMDWESAPTLNWEDL